MRSIIHVLYIHYIKKKHVRFEVVCLVIMSGIVRIRAWPTPRQLRAWFHLQSPFVPSIPTRLSFFRTVHYIMICICIDLSFYFALYTYVCICICMYIYIYISLCIDRIYPYLNVFIVPCVPYPLFVPILHAPFVSPDLRCELFGGACGTPIYLSCLAKGRLVDKSGEVTFDARRCGGHGDLRWMGYDVVTGKEDQSTKDSKDQ